MLEPTKYQVINAGEFKDSLNLLVKGPPKKAIEFITGAYYTQDGVLILPNNIREPSSVSIYGVTEDKKEGIAGGLKGLGEIITENGY